MTQKIYSKNLFNKNKFEYTIKHMNILESLEDYLERILMLKEKLTNVRSIDIAQDMGYSKPSVSIAMKKLKEKELIEIDSKGYITLTNEGEAIASKTYEKHKLIFNLLVSIGVSETTARDDACKIEHQLSEETVSKLKEFANKK